MTILVQELRAENAELRQEIDRLTVEIERHRSALIEREATRIAQALGQHDDQKWLDELLARGIQQDKDEIAKLKTEAEGLRLDAARYRWIEPVFAGLFGIDSMDQYIDRAMAKEQP